VFVHKLIKLLVIVIYVTVCLCICLFQASCKCNKRALMVTMKCLGVPMTTEDLIIECSRPKACDVNWTESSSAETYLYLHQDEPRSSTSRAESYILHQGSAYFGFHVCPTVHLHRDVLEAAARRYVLTTPVWSACTGILQMSFCYVAYPFALHCMPIKFLISFP
jgi:hypothetical protein